MTELELSIMQHDTDIDHGLQPWIKRFESQHHTRINLTTFKWDTAWSDMVKIALYGDGPDVSEIGSTWIGNFSAMNALESFDEREIAAMGSSPGLMLPALWAIGQSATDRTHFRAIPWLAYTRVIFYRRDLLERAGVDPSIAFRSPQHLIDALLRLVESGVAAPWGISTTEPFDSLHNLASWIWNAGGDFVSADGQHVLFNQPAARAGMRAYFDLYRFLKAQPDPDAAFRHGDSAVVMSSPQLWTAETLHLFDTPPEVAGRIGAALPFDAPFIGASHLVVWRHSRQLRAALDLIQYLISAPVQNDFAIRAGMLPARSDVLNHSPFSDDPNYQVMCSALQSSRSFPDVPMWGLIEDRLSGTLIDIWREVLADPQPDIDSILDRHLDPLALRLERVLSNQT